MSSPTLCVIGAGRAGGSLARQWHRSGGFQPLAIYTRQGRPELSQAIGAVDLTDITELPLCDAYLIATDDSSITEVSEKLANLHSNSWAGRTVFHLSGALSSKALEPFKRNGAVIASAHPVRAFSNDHSPLDGTLVGVEGMPKAVSMLKDAFGEIGGHCFDVLAENKILYHAAAVIASNHLVALADMAQQLWQASGVPSELQGQLFDSLTKGVLDNLKLGSPTSALTGPVARADDRIIQNHLSELKRLDNAIVPLYRDLSRYLIQMNRAAYSTEEYRRLLDCTQADTP